VVDRVHSASWVLEELLGRDSSGFGQESRGDPLR
jgi:hypothetical protein